MILAKPEQIEMFTSSGWWDTPTIDDLFCKWVAELGDAEAVVDPVNRGVVSGGAPRRLTDVAGTGKAKPKPRPIAIATLVSCAPSRSRTWHRL